jgi:hypothetical protein
LALATALAASLCGCAGDLDSAAPPSVTAPAAAFGSPPVVLDPDDPSCGLPASDAHFLEVAHAGYMRGVARVGNRVITQDKKRWVLWNLETRKAIASGPVHVDFRNVDLAGAVALTPSEDGRDLEVRSADDGQVTARIAVGDPSAGTRMLARDGSYVYVGTGRSLRVFDLTGRVLFQRTGDYSRIATYATPTELRVAQTAAPSVETFNLAGERVHARSFAGFFGAWFVDGSHYTTSATDGVRVFSAAGELVRFFPHRVALAADRARIATAGDGGFVWIQDPFEMFRVHSLRIDDGSIVDSFDGSFLDGANLSRVMFANPPTETVGELTIFEVDGRSRFPDLRRVPAQSYPAGEFSVDATGNWASVGYRGEVYVSKADAAIPPRALGCGSPLAIAAARERVAVLTADGRIRIFDLVNGQRQWLRTLDVLQDSYSADLAFAADGRYLIVHRKLRGDLNTRAPIDVFDLALLQPGEPAPSVVLRYGTDAEDVGFVATPHGEHIAISACAGGPATNTTPICEVHVSKLDGSMHWKTPRFPSLESLSLHPQGDRVAVTSQPYVEGLGWWEMPLYTLIFEAKLGLARTVPNTAVATFLDADRLLVRSNLDVRVIGLDGATLTSPAGKLLVDHAPVYSEDPAYFFQRAHVHRTSDASIVWRPTSLLQPITAEEELKYLDQRVTGFALAGDQVVVGIDDFVHLERFR